jgi:hypothetical protein
MKNILQIDKESDDDFNGGQEVTSLTTVVSMVNGMMGSNSLILPVLGLTSGWFTSIWTCLLAGYLLYYTAELIITHLGQSKNIKHSILAHFDNNYKYMSAYGIIIWVSFTPFIISGFNIICSEINGLVGYQSNWVTLTVLIVVVIATIVSRIFHWSEELMALGILGSVLFVLFEVWAIITAPSGPNTVPISGAGSPFNTISILVAALEIHDFLAQNIIKNPRKS